MTSPQHADSQKQMMLRWFEEVWNQGKRETIDELLGADFVIHDGGSAIRGPAEFKIFHDELRRSFSNFHVTPEHSITEGDCTLLRWRTSMTHIESGKPIEVTGMSCIRFRDGKFAEAWQNWDQQGLNAQVMAAAGK